MRCRYNSVTARLLFLALFFTFIVPISVSSAGEHPYLAELQHRAEQLNLASEREWQVLLHYSPRLFSPGVKSLVDDPDFFLHVQGKTNPQLELQATLAAFFQPHAEQDLSAQCRFPARFAWLRSQLDIDKVKLPSSQCRHLNDWLQTLAVTHITLVFPVSYLNNPASMFGHTFLRLDSRKHDTPDLLTWTVNYAADTAQERGISFALKGLFGGYPGKFSMTPYYLQVQGYGDVENRDIWEYQLNFTGAEINAMLLHLWELLPVYFDYFFIDENCSFQLLSLIEAARPQLRLTEQFQRDAIPADTVKAVVSVPGLLKSSKFRPSRRTVLLARTAKMSKAEQQLAKAIVAEQGRDFTAQLQGLSAVRRAQVLDLAFDIQAYENAQIVQSDQGVGNKNLSYDLLRSRSAVAVTSRAPEINAPVVRPDQGHKGNRIRLAYGYDDPGHYLDLQFRWAYHDLYDPEGGFIDGAQLEFFKPALRYYFDHRGLQFESLSFVDIASTPDYSSVLSPFSWKASAKLDRLRFGDADRPLMASFRGGFGLSFQLAEHSKLTMMALGAVHVSDRFHQFFGIGAGAEARLQHDFTRRWRIATQAKVLQYFLGRDHTHYELTLQQRYQIHQDHALVMKFRYANEFSNQGFVVGELCWRYYF